MNQFITKRWAIVALLVTALIGCQSSSHHQTVNTADSSSTASAKLGTQWGDGIESHVHEVNLYRISSNPLDLITIRYSAQAYNGKSVSEIMLNNGQIGISVLDDNNNKWSLVKQNNFVHLRGYQGANYRLQYHNYSKNTYEIVATVDGLDVLNGKAGSLSNNGYVLRPYGTLIIEGFRKSNSEVAAFKFSDSSSAYANHTDEGSAKNIGVIGTAIFQLGGGNSCNDKNSPNAFPADSSNGSYAKPPRY